MKTRLTKRLGASWRRDGNGAADTSLPYKLVCLSAESWEKLGESATG